MHKELIKLKKLVKQIITIEKKSRLNLVSNLFYQLLSVGLGLLLPFLFITNLGSEANGLLSSVGQAFTCLGLLEAGVGTATIQALYRPILCDDKKRINEILSATNKYYRKTGLWYGILVVFLAAIFPFLVDSNYSSLTIRLVILLQGIGAVITFLIQSKYTLLLRAEGRNYVVTFLMSVLLIVRNVGKIIAILLGYGIIAVQCVQLFTVLIEGVVIIVYVRKHYPWIMVNVAPDFKSISQKNAVFAQNLAWMVFNHTDILVLTAFSRNLKLISVYSVYLLVFEVGQNVINAITNSFQYKIGIIAQKQNDELDNYFSKYCIKIIVLIFAVISSVYLVGKPFISLYTRGASDIDYMVEDLPELFLGYKVLYCIRSLNKQVIEANGHFRQTSYIPLTEAVINIIVSIALVMVFDIKGVLLGTIVSLIIGVSMYLKYLSKIIRISIENEIQNLLAIIPAVTLVVIIGRLNIIADQSWSCLLFEALPICIGCLALYSLSSWITALLGTKGPNRVV